MIGGTKSKMIRTAVKKKNAENTLKLRLQFRVAETHTTLSTLKRLKSVWFLILEDHGYTMGDPMNTLSIGQP